MEKFVYSFLKNTYLYELPVRILNVTKNADGTLVEFTDSIFHPQGGGQPNDSGRIKIGAVQIPILSAINNRETGKILYKLDESKQQLLKPDQQVVMVIDKDIRIRNARLHSAGHLIDVAVRNLKYEWKPSKGYHFADSPYVEYIGACDDLAKCKDSLQKEIDLLTIEHAQAKVDVDTLNVQQALDKKVIDESFKGESVRMVGIMGVECPCAGTHVEKIVEVGKLQVTKVAKKSKNIRVSYALL